MKKFALLAATLICFAGCAQNETDEMGAADTTGTDDTAVGTSASSQSGSISSMDTNTLSYTNDRSSTLSLDTNQSSSTLSQDTNNVGQPGSIQSETQPLPPTPPSTDNSIQQPQQGGQPNP